MEVPGHQKRDLSRTVHTVSGLPFDEQMAAHVGEDAARVRLYKLVRRSAMPPAYTEHSVMNSANGGAVAPVALYVDAVPKSRTDSVIGVWLSHVHAGCGRSCGRSTSETATTMLLAGEPVAVRTWVWEIALVFPKTTSPCLSTCATARRSTERSSWNHPSNRPLEHQARWQASWSGELRFLALLIQFTALAAN